MINPGYDDKFLHLGFSLGINSMDYSLTPSRDMLFADTVYAVNHVGSPGFSIGIVTDLKIFENLNFRFVPTMDFGARSLEYKMRDFDEDTVSFYTYRMNYSSIYLNFPLLLKLRAKRINNYRPYMIGGVSFKYDIDARRAKEKNDGNDVIIMKAADYFIEVGGGVDFYLPYFRFATEVKMCFGFNNILQPDNSEFTSTLSKIRTKMLVISLLFE